jgi:hypothetical protein
MSEGPFGRSPGRTKLAEPSSSGAVRFYVSLKQWLPVQPPPYREHKDCPGYSTLSFQACLFFLKGMPLRFRNHDRRGEDHRFHPPNPPIALQSFTRDAPFFPSEHRINDPSKLACSFPLKSSLAQSTFASCCIFLLNNGG